MDDKKKIHAKKSLLERLAKREGYAGTLKDLVEYQGLEGPPKSRIIGSSDYGTYYDPIGKLTGGIGSLAKDEDDAAQMLTLTKEQAEERLLKDTKKAESFIDPLLKEHGIDPNTIGDTQKEGLLGALFQLGKGKLTTNSKGKKKGTGLTGFVNTFDALKKEDYGKMADEVMDSDWYEQSPNRVEDFIKLMSVGKERDDLREDVRRLGGFKTSKVSEESTEEANKFADDLTNPMPNADGGVIKEYANGGITPQLTPEEEEKARQFLRPREDIESDRSYERSTDLYDSLKEDVGSLFEKRPESMEREQGNFLTPDIAQRRAAVLGDPKRLEQRRGIISERIKTDEDILDELVQKLKAENRFEDGGFVRPMGATPIDELLKEFDEAREGKPLEFKAKPRLEEGIKPLGVLEDRRKGQRRDTTLQEMFGTQPEGRRKGEISGQRPIFGQSNNPLKSKSKLPSDLESTLKDNEVLRDIFDGDVNKRNEIMETLKRKKGPAQHTYSDFGDSNELFEGSRFPDDMRNPRYEMKEKLLTSGRMKDIPVNRLDAELDQLANSGVLSAKDSDKLTNISKNAKEKQALRNQKIADFEASKFNAGAGMTDDAIEAALIGRKGVPKNKLKRKLLQTMSKAGRAMKPFAKGVSKILPGVGLAATGASLYSSMAEGADIPEALRREIESEPLVMAGKAMSDIAPAKGAAMRAGRDKTMQLLEELRAKEQATPQLSPEEEEAAKQFVKPKFSEGGAAYEYGEDPILDMIRKAGGSEEGDKGYMANEKPISQEADPIQEEAPMPVSKPEVKTPEVDEVEGRGPSSDEKPKLDVQSKYEQILAELEKPKKQEEYGGPSWGSALADSLATLSNIYNYAQGEKMMFKPSSMASERERFDAQQKLKKDAESSSLAQRADILNQLQKLKDGSKPMTAYQQQYLEYLKGSQGKREETEARIKEQSKKKMSRQNNKDIYQVVQDYKKDDVVKELRKQGISFDQAESLLTAIDQDNKVAYGALGTKMARAMGEVGVLTDADVVRYIQRYDVPGKVKDWFSGKFRGKPSDLTQKDLEHIANIMKIGATNQLSRIKSEYIDHAYQNFAKDIDMSLEEVEKRFGIKNGKLPKSANPPKNAKNLLKKQYSPSRNKTKFIYDDGTEEIKDGKL